MERRTLVEIAVVPWASVLGCIVEQIVAVSRLRGLFDLPDAAECSLTVILIMVPSVAVGPSGR